LLIELVQASASGLDPHLSPQASLLQVPRIDKARGIPETTVLKLIHEATEQPQPGIPGCSAGKCTCAESGAGWGE